METLNRLLMIIGFVWIFSLISINGQTQTAQSSALVIENEAGQQVEISLADLGKIKRQIVKADDHGKEAAFEGFPLVEVLKLGGIEFGETLRGKRLATFLLVEAADNYQAVFALPELDPAFTERIILLADRRDNQPLAKPEGLLRVIVPGEKKQGRWVRQVTKLKILRAAPTAGK